MGTIMTITRGLAELTLLDNRISRAITEATLITTKKSQAKNVLNGRKTVEEFSKEAKATYQSITDLIERRKRIKELIVESNAKTKVVISNKEYTVASAIERKSSIGYEKELLKKLTSSLAVCERKVEDDNQRVENEINSMNLAYMTKENSVSETMLKMNTEYREQNQSIMVDPLNLKNLIDNLRRDIEDFENEVDFVLSESNSINHIEIE